MTDLTEYELPEDIMTTRARLFPLLPADLFSGQTWFITGALLNSITHGIALAAGQKGAQIAIAGKSEVEAQAVADDLRRRGVEPAQVYWADFRDLEAAQALGRQAARDLDKIHVFSAVAGWTLIKPFGELTPRELVDIGNINVNSHVLIAGEFLRAGAFAQQAYVIPFSSIHRHIFRNGHHAYRGTKGQIVDVFTAFAASHGRKGIRVFIVSPGWVDVQRHRDDVDGMGYVKGMQESAETGPIDWIATPLDVGALVTLLASGDMDYATGTIIEFTGGMHITGR